MSNFDGYTSFDPLDQNEKNKKSGFFKNIFSKRKPENVGIPDKTKSGSSDVVYTFADNSASHLGVSNPASGAERLSPVPPSSLQLPCGRIPQGGGRDGQETSNQDDDVESTCSDTSCPEEVVRNKKPLLNVFKNISKIIKDGGVDLKTMGNPGSDIRRYWMPDETCRECYECGVAFSTFKRKHHCRICGQIFCHRCSNQVVPGRLVGEVGKQRACGYCASMVLRCAQVSAPIPASPSTPAGQPTTSEQTTVRPDVYAQMVMGGGVVLDGIRQNLGRGGAARSLRLRQGERDSARPGGLKSTVVAADTVRRRNSLGDLSSAISSPSRPLPDAFSFDLNSTTAYPPQMPTHHPSLAAEEESTLPHTSHLSTMMPGIRIKGMFKERRTSSVIEITSATSFSDLSTDRFENGLRRRRSRAEAIISRLDGERLGAIWSNMTSGVRGVGMTDQRSGLRLYKRCVVGSRLVDWLVSHEKARTRLDGCLLCQKFLELQLLVPIHHADEAFFKDDCTFYAVSDKTDEEVTQQLKAAEIESDRDQAEPDWLKNIQVHHSIAERYEIGDMDDPSSNAATATDALTSITAQSTDLLPPGPSQIQGKSTFFLDKASRGSSIAGTSQSPNSPASPSGGKKSGQSGIQVGRKAKGGQLDDDKVSMPECSSVELENGQDDDDKAFIQQYNRSYRDYIQNLVHQEVMDEHLPLHWVDIIASLSRKVTEKVWPDVKYDNDKMDIRHYVKIKKLPDSNSTECELFFGVCCSKNVAHKKMSTESRTPKILLLASSIEFQRNENKLSSLESQIMQEEDYLRNCVNKVLTLKPDLLVVERTVSQLAQEFLLEQGITLVYNVKRSVMEGISRMTQADLVESVDSLITSNSKPRLGCCEIFYVQTFNLLNGSKKSLLFMKAFAIHSGCTVILRGAALAELKQVKRVLSFALLAYYNARREIAYAINTCLRTECPPNTSLDTTAVPSSPSSSTVQLTHNLSNQAIIHSSNPTPVVSNAASASTLSNNPPKSPGINSTPSVSVTTSTPSLSPNPAQKQPPSNSFKFVSNPTVVKDGSDPLQRRLSQANSEGVLTLQEMIKGRYLSMSLNCPVVPTYLDMIDETKCSLQKYFKSFIDFSFPRQLESLLKRKNKIIEANQYQFSKEKSLCSPELIKSSEPHAFQKRALTTYLLSGEDEMTYLDFRSRGGCYAYKDGHEIRSKKPIAIMSPPTEAVTEKIKREAEKKRRLEWNLLDIRCHQKISFLFTNYTTFHSSSFLPCMAPWTITIHFYGRKDLTLGQFLEQHCFRTPYPCPYRNCNVPMLNHSRRFIHGNGSIKLLLKKLDQEIPSHPGDIVMWSYCQACKKVSRLMPMSNDTWHLSFAKFLDLHFNGEKSFCRVVGEGPGCTHSLYHDHYQYFGFRSIVASFKFTPITLYETFLPPAEIHFKDPQDEKIPEELITEARDAVKKYYTVYGEVKSYIFGVEQKKYADEKKTSEDLQEILKSLRHILTECYKDRIRDKVNRIEELTSADTSSEPSFVIQDSDNPVQRCESKLSLAERILCLSETIVEVKTLIVEFVHEWDEKLASYHAQEKRLERELRQKIKSIATTAALTDSGQTHSSSHLLPPDTSRGSFYTPQFDQTSKNISRCNSSLTIDALDNTDEAKFFIPDNSRQEDVFNAPLVAKSPTTTSQADFKEGPEGMVRRHRRTSSCPPARSFLEEINSIARPYNSVFVADDTVANPDDDVEETIDAIDVTTVAGVTEGIDAALGDQTLDGFFICSSQDFTGCESPNCDPTPLMNDEVATGNSTSSLPRVELIMGTSDATFEANDRISGASIVSPPVMQLAEGASVGELSTLHPEEISVPLGSGKERRGVSESQMEMSPSIENSWELQSRRPRNTTLHQLIGKSPLHSNSGANSGAASPGVNRKSKDELDASSTHQPSKSVFRYLTNLLSSYGLKHLGEPFSIHEHYNLPPSYITPVYVNDEELASIVAYSLSSKEYNDKLALMESGSQQKSNAMSENFSDSQTPIITPAQSSRSVPPVTVMTSSVSLNQSQVRVSYNPTALEDTIGQSSGTEDLPSTPTFPGSKSNNKASGINQKSVTESGLQENNDLSDRDISINFSDSSFKFYCKVYYATEFHALRKLLLPQGERVFIRSLARCYSWEAKGGKGGSYFMKTLDDRFVIKQLTPIEMKLFHDIADDYFKYTMAVIKNKSLSVLAKIVGVFRIAFKNSMAGTERKMDIVVQENLFYRQKISLTFDLKGSERNRMASEEGDAVLLDENLVRRSLENPLYVRWHSKSALMAALQADSNFLSVLSIMDYSLLVGIDKTNQQLVVGIIDYLRSFTLDKKLEYMWKKAMTSEGIQPTIISPDNYRCRFLEKMKSYFLLVPDQWFDILERTTE